MIWSAIIAGIHAMLGSMGQFSWQQGVMIAIGCLLMYLGVAKEVEPLLLVPIGFSALMVNVPGTGLMEGHGFLKAIFDAGIVTELFPILVFVGIGAMTDFGPLMENPKIVLFGAAGQFGIFLTLLLALALGYTQLESLAIGIIGACDGPTAIYVTTNYAPHLLGSVSVAAYSYMALVPILQPPIMRALTTEEERKIVMPTVKRSVSKTTKLVFPIVVTLFTAIVAPMGTPLMAPLMLGNLFREVGGLERLAKTAANELGNIVTLLLGLAIGATMQAQQFLNLKTLGIFALGLTAISLDTVMGVLFGKVMKVITGGKVNPLIGAAGISALPMAARVVQAEGQKWNKKNHLLMQAMGANTGGQVGSIMAAAIMLSIVNALGIH